jgi:hypothetical protein
MDSTKRLYRHVRGLCPNAILASVIDWLVTGNAFADLVANADIMQVFKEEK